VVGKGDKVRQVLIPGFIAAPVRQPRRCAGLRSRVRVCPQSWPCPGRKLFAGTIEAADPRELVLKWSAFLATAERGTYFATYRGSFVGPEPALENSDTLAA